MSNSKFKYRPDIDGMRAFAVIAVLIGHISEKILPGGFVGVDVFFVISGFVVTGSILTMDASGPVEFISTFYKRRVKRILPALLFCVFITYIAVTMLIPFNFTKDVLYTAATSLFGASNFQLYVSGGDYFALNQELNPFTHTWSLGVEEQFYLFYPLLILLFIPFSGDEEKDKKNKLLKIMLVGAVSSLILHKLFPQDELGRLFSHSKKVVPLIPVLISSIITLRIIFFKAFKKHIEIILAILIVGVLVSAGMSYYLTVKKPIMSFFFMPSRFWELSLGGILFILTSKIDKAIFLNNVLVLRLLEGLIFIGAVVSLFFTPSHSGFPFPWAILPVAYTFLMILIGSYAREKSLIFKFFSKPLAVKIGKLSYSLYLWHWPVIVLFKWTVGLENFLHILLCLVISVVLSIVSYNFVEVAWRFKRGKISYVLPLLGITIFSIFLIKNRANKEVVDNYVFTDVIKSMPENHIEKMTCHKGGVYTKEWLDRCLAVSPGQETKARLYTLGDSHMAAHVPMIKEYCEENDCVVSQLTGGPMILTTGKADKEYVLLLDYFKDNLKEGDIITASFHRNYFYDTYPLREEYDLIKGGENVDVVKRSKISRQQFKDNMNEIVKIAKEKKASVILFEDVPLLSYGSIPACIIQDKFMGKSICDTSREHSRKHALPSTLSYKNLAQENENVFFFELHDDLCKGEVCSHTKDGKVTYIDSGHVSNLGALTLKNKFTDFVKTRL